MTDFFAIRRAYQNTLSAYRALFLIGVGGGYLVGFIVGLVTGVYAW